MPKEIELPRRDKELAVRKDSKLYRDLIKDFATVRKAFEDQAERSDTLQDYWDIYNCVLNNHQFYDGNSQIYVPIVMNAIEARTTRFLNQLFPASGRYIDATSVDGGVPHAIVALLETYIANMKLRSQIMEALLTNGDVEGHYHLYVDWNRIERHIVSRETRKASIQIPGMPGVGDAGEDVEDLIPESIIEECPEAEPIHDSDIVVWPATAQSIDHALAEGGSVTIIRRWTKQTLEDMIDRGEVCRKPAEHLLEMSGKDDIYKNPEKIMIDAAGIRDRGKTFQVYEMWKCLDTDEGRRLCRSLYGGYDLILSAKRGPFWNDRCGLLSAPQKKIAGAFKGVSLISKGVDTLQYHANQVAQQAADSATYSMLPIVMTDPAKNPRTSTMILNLAAIWECDPASTRFAEFPKLWQDGIALIQADVQSIFQTMGVNPAMLPQQTGRPGAKRNQAEIALEQTVDILQTAKACGVIEEGILTPFLDRCVDYDHQFRDAEMTIKMYGEIGSIAKMESVPPQQTRHRFQFTWFGVEQARNAAQQQQQIAFLNVARGLSQDLQKAGYMLDPAPALEHAAGNIFGWRMGRQVIRDMRQQLSMDPMTENIMLAQGFDVVVHPMDPDPEHLKAHMMAMQAEGDPTGMFKIHITRHQQSMQMKAQAMMRQAAIGQPPQGAGPPQPGAPGPQAGAQPQGPKLVRGPPGAIHPDQMPRAGGVNMPRKM